MLEDPQWQLREVVQRHLEDTTHRIDLALSLRARLLGMASALARHDGPSPDQLFATLEEMTLLDATVHSTTALLVYDDLAAAQEYLVPSMAFLASGFFLGSLGWEVKRQRSLGYCGKDAAGNVRP